jgi:hypothetical protein
MGNMEARIERGTSPACEDASQRLHESACESRLDFNKLNDAILTESQKQAKQALSSVIEFFHGGRPAHELLSVGRPQAGNDLRQEQLFFSRLDVVLTEMKPNQTVNDAQFDSMFGQDAQVMRAAGLVSITRDAGNHMTMKFQSPQTFNTTDGIIYRADTVECDFSRRNGVSELSNITGIRASSGVTATVDDLRIAHLPNGNTRIDAEGHWGLFSGERTLLFGPDGESISPP